MEEHEHTHGCMGSKWLVVGLLVIANNYYAWFDWWYFLGGLLVLKGLWLLVMKGHCMCHGKKSKK
ncbi:TPA: hypothetical protein HA239_04650 [Candidatus Woesearchaeota archaeon]|nr:hypothetical protein QT06_C0001G0108 [archaeon GW2011_AR15]MBS3104087.1 hypothetical protein [Candidatus Woesearchaeota archaeon]HIH41678.1 hypothetical protein [Candidatus Woesearchaeota archaeon]